jgi:protein-L-isoaspartate(D-aspartate) O-methyltransferase
MQWCRRTLGNLWRMVLPLFGGVLWFRLLPAVFVLLPPSQGFCIERQSFSAARLQMVAEISKDVKETSSYLGRKTLSEKVMTALATVPRHLFVPEELEELAYKNRPLPIGHGQTISQPYIVAVMTDLLDLEPSDKVLEIGTGSGYQAAVLAEIVRQVYTIEIIEPLYARAMETFRRLGKGRIKARSGDGYYGWPEEAPFDGIIVTAAASHIPPPLVAQLKNGGRMIVPVGSFFSVQQLVLVEKNKEGAVTLRQILPVNFVPLTGGH